MSIEAVRGPWTTCSAWPRLVALTAAALAMGSAPPAGAAPLSAVTSSVQCQAVAPVATDIQVGDRDCAAGGEGLFAVGAARTSPFNTVVGEASALEPGPGRHASVTGMLSFEFQLLGGSAGDLVPVLIASHLLAQGDDADHRWARASMQVSQVDSGATTVSACTPGVACGGDAEYFGLVMVWLRSGGAEGGPAASIELSIEAFAGDSDEPESAFASANYAHVLVHPSFANADRYSLIFSDGITNAPPDDLPVLPPPLNVPEPATGLLALAAMAWPSVRRLRRRC